MNGEAFIAAARALECDESEERFNAALGKISAQRTKSPDIPAKEAVIGPKSSPKAPDPSAE